MSGAVWCRRQRGGHRLTGVIELDPWWRLVVVLGALGVVPLLLAGEVVLRAARRSVTVVLLRSWWRGVRYRSGQRSRHRRTRRR